MQDLACVYLYQINFITKKNIYTFVEAFIKQRKNKKLFKTMTFPNNLKYTKDHEWIRIEGNIAFIGITDFAQGELGDIVYIDITTLGDELDREDIFGTVEAVKTVSDLFMPISGKIIEVNKVLDTNPAAVNKDPYGDGWMIKVEMKDATEVNSLLSESDYRSLIGQ
jgi:glycine cleavage system H protein